MRKQAGVGTKLDVLIARYLRRHCEIQRIKLELGKNDTVSNTIKESIRESQSQSQKPEDLAESERLVTETRQEYYIPNSLFNSYITNIKLLQKLNSQGRSLEIHTDDSDIQKLYEQQLNDAIELYRLTGLRLAAGVIDDNSNTNEIMLPAVLIAIADMNLATEATEREIAKEMCL